MTDRDHWPTPALTPNPPLDQLPATYYPRRITQLAGTGGCLYALADDGSVWMFTGSWHEIPALPTHRPAGGTVL